MAYTDDTSNSNAFDFQLPESGFGSYVRGILPESDAVLAGAFGVSMQQIKNIQNVNLERFAQVVYSLETNEGLPLTNGTNVPTDKFLVDQALSKIALGSDIYGTYNMSNFFGCMSGLPYPLMDIFNGIRQLETTKLYNIYDQMYLAVKWEQATCTATVGTDGLGNYFLQSLSNFTGCGYGRGSAPPPTITITNGAGFNPTATLEIGTDPNDISTYGKIKGYTITNFGTQPTNPGSLTVYIQAPPTASLPVQADGNVAVGGVNTAFGTVAWPSMNTVIQNYIDQANAEITAIQNANQQNFQAAKILNTNYNILGTMLKIEQRSRYIGRPPAPIPYYDALIPYPQSLYGFVDSLPFLAQDTNPNGPVQNLETVADFCSPAGQSLIGMMRQERNQARLNLVGLNLDNNISTQLDPELAKTKLVNGTVPEAVEGVTSDTGVTYTTPAWSATNRCDNTLIEPMPIAYYDPEINNLRLTDDVQSGNIASILQDDNPVVATEVPRGIGIPVVGLPGAPPNTVPTEGIRTVGLFPIINVLPPTLDRTYISSTVMPSSYDVKSAIDKVIECNCDCWVN